MSSISQHRHFLPHTANTSTTIHLTPRRSSWNAMGCNMMRLALYEQSASRYVYHMQCQHTSSYLCQGTLFCSTQGAFQVKKIQLQDEDSHIPSKNLKQLLMDMKVQWSSTYIMLEQAESLKEEVDYFVWQLGLQEKDSDKAQKLLTMQLTSTEWEHVKHILSLLGVCSVLSWPVITSMTSTSF